jgi:ferredoxin
VDADVCIGSGNCARTAPATFGQSDADGVVVLLEPEPPAGRRPAVRVAVAQCPVAAIALDERAGGADPST